jgi:hypothetical protein
MSRLQGIFATLVPVLRAATGYGLWARQLLSQPQPGTART